MQCDSVTVWWSISVTVRQCDSLTWQFDRVTGWQFARVAVWQCYSETLQMCGSWKNVSVTVWQVESLTVLPCDSRHQRSITNIDSWYSVSQWTELPQYNISSIERFVPRKHFISDTSKQILSLWKIYFLFSLGSPYCADWSGHCVLKSVGRLGFHWVGWLVGYRY